MGKVILDWKGQKAYRAVRKNGGSKEEACIAREAAKNATSEAFIKRLSHFEGGNHLDNIGYDFDSDLNGNGTHWHTSEDL